jgi:DNA-binding MarR family transcriptional regulator
VPLNIDPTQSTTQASRELREEVLNELTSWNPREFIAAFQRWHQGTFSLVHLNVLTLLEAGGSMSMSRLAEALDVSVASMTGIVDRMEKRGLVERRRDEQDRRVVLVQPAKGGRKVFGDIDARRRKGLQKLLDHLSDDDLAGLLQGHRALRAARQAFAENMTVRKVPGTRLIAVEAKK